MIYRSPQPDLQIPDIPYSMHVLRRAAELGCKPALIDASSGVTLTYGELAHGVERVAAHLAQRGFRQGDVLVIYAPNSPEFVMAFHAAASLGGIVSPVNPLCPERELAHRLMETQAAWLVVDSGTREVALRAASTGAVREVFSLDDALGTTSFASLLRGDAPASPAPTIRPERDLAALLYSSGTGGPSKGVMLTHRNLVAGLCQLAAAEPCDGNEVILGILPFFHMYGLSVLHYALAQGATLVMLPRFELHACLQALQEYLVTRAFLAPPVLVSLAKHSLVDDFDLSHLRIVQSGGAPLGEAIAREVAARVGCEVRQAYALTECYPALRIGDTDPHMRRAASVGRPVAGLECMIVDPATSDALGTGQAGELWLRGPQVMAGYLNQPAATATAITTDGWLRTGDLVCIDRDGFVTVVDRLKELIKYKGYQVARAELEALLLTHPAVADAAVIPSPDELAGEVPKAFIVARREITPDELLAWVAERVAPYQRIRRLQFVAEIPKSPSGKILRRVLVEQERAAMCSK